MFLGYQRIHNGLEDAAKEWTMDRALWWQKAIIALVH
jgi:hypothetical protein